MRCTCTEPQGEKTGHCGLFCFTSSQTSGCAEVPALNLTSSWGKSSWHRPGTNASCSGSHFLRPASQKKTQTHKLKQTSITIVRQVEVLPLYLYFPVTLQSFTISPCPSFKHLFLSWHRFTREGKEVNARDYSPCSAQHVRALAQIPLLFLFVSCATCCLFSFPRVLQ